MDSLGVDLKLFIAQIVNFALFFFIFKKFIAKPFANFLSDEAKKDKDKDKMLNELKTKEENMIASQNKAKAQMKKELDMAIKKSKEEALTFKKTLIADAKIEAEKLVEKAKKQIEVEKSQADREIKKKIIDLSTMIVDQGLEKYLDKNSMKEINKNILKNLPKNIN